MSSPPAAMQANKRPANQIFHHDEFLFRRVPTWIWDDPAEELGLEAIELPDISVARSKFGHAEWARFDVINFCHYEDWAVVGVIVERVPPAIWREGFPRFVFEPRHVPLDRDYSHSEIQAFDESGGHVKVIDSLPDDIHLEWRYKLLREIETIIKPFQRVLVRETPPTTHKLEPHTVIA